MNRTSIGRVLAASLSSLALLLGATSCSNDYTVAYVYMTTAKTTPHGLINAYQVDYQSGFLYTLADSPVDTGGRNTVALVATPDNLALYTINRDDSSVVQFDIGTDGKLYPEQTYNVSGSFATSAAIDPQGKFLYVTFTYQNGPAGQQLYTTANPGPGGISIFPIHGKPSSATDPTQYSLGTPVTVNVGRNPIAIAVSPSNGTVYVLDQDATTSANLLAFSQTGSSPALAPLAGVTINSGNVASTGFSVGTMPAGLLLDSTGTHLYVTDQAANTVSAFTLGSNGVPTLAGTTSTDAGPEGMALDLSGKYLYVVAYNANTVDGYTLNASGVPVRSSTAAATATGTGPTCISFIGAPRNSAPSHAEYMYISNQLSNNVSGEQINTSTGALDQIQGGPFGGSTLPTCLVTVPALPLR